MTQATGYEPLFTLKPVAEDIWIVDGPILKFYGMPYPTRMVVVRLPDGALWLHSPIQPDDSLIRDLLALGPIAHLIAPNWIHYAYVATWAQRFPQALVWAAPGVAERAASRGIALHVDGDLQNTPPPEWSDVIDQRLVEGSAVHREVVFFHRPSETLVLTDLIENFEASHVPVWFVPMAWMAGILDPDGKAPIDMRTTFRKRKPEVKAAVEAILAWHPQRAIMAHGRWYPQNAEAELRRAFRWVLD